MKAPHQRMIVGIDRKHRKRQQRQIIRTTRWPRLPQTCDAQQFAIVARYFPSNRPTTLIARLEE
jgi:hypothetical protein